MMGDTSFISVYDTTCAPKAEVRVTTTLPFNFMPAATVSIAAAIATPAVL
jgi:hypothetical protein